jgi:hypothetical protein
LLIQQISELLTEHIVARRITDTSNIPEVAGLYRTAISTASDALFNNFSSRVSGYGRRDGFGSISGNNNR